jgi:hypothetical protein
MRYTYVKAKFSTRGFTTEPTVYRVCNASQMRALGYVITAASRPNENIVCQMTRDAVRLFFWSSKSSS